MKKEFSIRRILNASRREIDELVTVLIDCVEGDASVSFMHPLSRERATEFWEHVAMDLPQGHRVLLVAEDPTGICGTVQLLLQQPENQPHRADLAKMLVHRRARRQGVGAALMCAAETVAKEHRRSVLVLDTVTGGDGARLYERLGWVRVGEIPNYALMPRGGLCGTTYYYKKIPS